jgi:putative aldouronate transport system substrate-binding protein
MAAGTPPDVCVSYSHELVASYRDRGGLLDLSPYIDTLLVDLKEFLGPDLALPGRDFIRRYENPETGAIYALPARRINTAMRSVFIRKDWLDTLGLPLPSTTEEFYETLVAFRDHDPGGVGRNNVVPFLTGHDIFWGAQAITYPFIDQNLSIRDRWVNSVIDRYYALPGFKEGIRFLNKMYNEGLIDRNFPLYRTESDVFNVLKAGYAGSYSDNWDRIYRDSDLILEDLQKNVPGADMVPVNCTTDINGIIRRSAYDAVGALMFIPASCKNPEAALRYINWLARFENYNFLQIGPEGIVHDMIDGLPKIRTVTGVWIQNSPQNIDYTLHINGLDMGDPELTIKAIANGYSWPAELIENAYNMAMTNASPGPVIPVTLSAAGPYVQTLIDKGNYMLTEAVTTRPENFDRVWDAGMRDWLNSGAQEIINERQAKFVEP